MSTAAVEVSNLTRRFGPVVAVENLSFSVSRGELFGIVGPDGAGKTTTLRMLAGVLRPTAGDARVCGASVVRDPEGVKDRIGYVSQRFGLYQDLTVRENLEFYADLYRVPKELRGPRRERLYRFSGLGEFEDRLAGNLSGGMKQKLGLCCALIHEPEVLLLDEPTFGVDPISRRDLWIIVHQMVARGVTVVVSTAYLDEAERCDRIAVLHRGSLLALDSPSRLQASLGRKIWSIRTGDLPRAQEVLKSVPGVKRATRFGDALHLILADPAGDRDRVVEALSRAGIALLGAEEVEPSLEDVFIEMTRGGRDG
jgi:ABC-2 type transport system ATP-binding protein